MFCCAIISVCLTGIGCAGIGQTANPDSDIYSAIINYYTASNPNWVMVWVGDKTVFGSSIDFPQNATPKWVDSLGMPESFRRYNSTRHDSELTAIWDNYRLNNREAHSVTADSLHTKVKSFLTHFSKDGQVVFYFSCPGFNLHMDRAIVYTEEANWAPLSGEYFVLRKVDGRWVIEDKFGGWVS